MANEEENTLEQMRNMEWERSLRFNHPKEQDESRFEGDTSNQESYGQVTWMENKRGIYNDTILMRSSFDNANEEPAKKEKYQGQLNQCVNPDNEDLPGTKESGIHVVGNHKIMIPESTTSFFGIHRYQIWVQVNKRKIRAYIGRGSRENFISGETTQQFGLHVEAKDMIFVLAEQSKVRMEEIAPKLKIQWRSLQMMPDFHVLPKLRYKIYYDNHG